MGNYGGGQLTVMRAFNTDGTVAPSAKLYHYDAGTVGGVETELEIYSDEALTTSLAQPFVANSAGEFVFYGKGDYDFVIKTSADVTLATYEHYRIDKGGSSIAYSATDYPAANANNYGLIFPVVDGSDVLRKLGFSNGSSWTDMLTWNAAAEQTYDEVITLTKPVYNVTHGTYGAVGDGATDDTDAFQDAIDDIVAAGGGILYAPGATYAFEGTLDIDNAPIFFLGDGSGYTIFKQTVDPGTPMIDYDTNDITHMFKMQGIAFQTGLASAFGAVNHFAPSTSGTTSGRNIIIEDVRFGPTVAQYGTAYFDDCLIVSDAKRGSFRDIFCVGKDGASSENGITFNGYSVQNMVDNVFFENIQTRYTMGANATENRFRERDIPDTLTLASAATVTLDQFSDLFEITGSTDIVTINGGYNGRIVTLMGAAASGLNITDGGNKNTAGAFAMAVGDTIVLQFMGGSGGTWYELSRSNN
jgi:hypothetical protein